MGGRRANGEGTYYVRCRKCNGSVDEVRRGKYRCVKCGGDEVRWNAQATVTQPNGERKRVTVSGRTKQEASDKLAELTASERKGETVATGKATVAEFMQNWLTDVAAGTMKPSSLAEYRRTIRNHILPGIGAHALHQLRPKQIQEFYGALLAAGQSRRSVQRIHSIIRRAFNNAVEALVLPRSPLIGVKPPVPGRRDPSVYTPDQVRQLLTALEGDMHGPFYHLALASGCRRGELVALRWSDVDLDTGTIRITRAAQDVDGKISFAEPKTDRSRRTIPLPPSAVALLKKHRARQAQQVLQLAEAERAFYEDRGLVFCRKDGSPLVPGQLSQHFALLLRKAGLPPIRLHDLRHTHATLLMAAGTHPKVVSERLGHSTITRTLDTYSHVLPTMQEEVARTWDSVVGQNPERKKRAR